MIFPLDPIVVNRAVLGVTLPIGVACNPAGALIVVPTVALPLTVKPLTVALPLVL